MIYSRKSLLLSWLTCSTHDIKKSRNQNKHLTNTTKDRERHLHTHTLMRRQWTERIWIIVVLFFFCFVVCRCHRSKRKGTGNFRMMHIIVCKFLRTGSVCAEWLSHSTRGPCYLRWFSNFPNTHSSICCCRCHILSTTTSLCWWWWRWWWSSGFSVYLQISVQNVYPVDI